METQCTGEQLGFTPWDSAWSPADSIVGASAPTPAACCYVTRTSASGRPRGCRNVWSTTAMRGASNTARMNWGQQRLYAIALGHEDLDDHGDRRSGPALSPPRGGSRAQCLPLSSEIIVRGAGCLSRARPEPREPRVGNCPRPPGRILYRTSPEKPPDSAPFPC